MEQGRIYLTATSLMPGKGTPMWQIPEQQAWNPESAPCPSHPTNQTYPCLHVGPTRLGKEIPVSLRIYWTNAGSKTWQPTVDGEHAVGVQNQLADALGPGLLDGSAGRLGETSPSRCRSRSAPSTAAVHSHFAQHPCLPRLRGLQRLRAAGNNVARTILFAHPSEISFIIFLENSQPSELSLAPN